MFKHQTQNMKYLKKFNEGYNLNTLKAYVDTNNKLYVRIKNKPGIHQVLNIDVKSLHDGVLQVKPVDNDNVVMINHDDIDRSITQDELNDELQKDNQLYNVTESLESKDSIDKFVEEQSKSFDSYFSRIARSIDMQLNKKEHTASEKTKLKNEYLSGVEKMILKKLKK